MDNTANRRLLLDRETGWIGGVCAGLARTLGTDPAIVRVATVVTGLFMTKIVIAVYLISWLVLDRREED